LSPKLTIKMIDK